MGSGLALLMAHNDVWLCHILNAMLHKLREHTSPVYLNFKIINQSTNQAVRPACSLVYTGFPNDSAPFSDVSSVNQPSIYQLMMNDQSII